MFDPHTCVVIGVLSSVLETREDLGPFGLYLTRVHKLPTEEASHSPVGSGHRLMGEQNATGSMENGVVGARNGILGEPCIQQHLGCGLRQRSAIQRRSAAYSRHETTFARDRLTKWRFALAQPFPLCSGIDLDGWHDICADGELVCDVREL